MDTRVSFAWPTDFYHRIYIYIYTILYHRQFLIILIDGIRPVFSRKSNDARETNPLSISVLPVSLANQGARAAEENVRAYMAIDTSGRRGDEYDRITGKKGRLYRRITRSHLFVHSSIHEFGLSIRYSGSENTSETTYISFIR